MQFYIDDIIYYVAGSSHDLAIANLQPAFAQIQKSLITHKHDFKSDSK